MTNLTDNPHYSVLQGDSLYKINHFFGGYIGLDCRVYLLNFFGNEIDILGGIAFDGWDALEKEVSSLKKAKGINSLNLNTGIGYRYNFNKNTVTLFIGPEIRYKFVWYGKANKGGTNLAGNTITILLVFGFGAEMNH